MPTSTTTPASAAPRSATHILVGLRDPLHSRTTGVLLDAALTTDGAGRAMVKFTPPGFDTGQSVELAHLGDTWGQLHTSGWSVRAFPADSPAHLLWQITETQTRIAQLVNAKPIQDGQTAAAITTLAAQLRRLVRRHRIAAATTGVRAAA